MMGGRFCVQCLPIRSYSYWDGNLILAYTGQESSWRRRETQKYGFRIQFKVIDCNQKQSHIWELLILSSTRWAFFIEKVTQLAQRTLQTPLFRTRRPAIAMVTLKLYTSCLSQSALEPGGDLLSKHTQLKTANHS